jgi:hypothetical protein
MLWQDLDVNADQQTAGELSVEANSLFIKAKKLQPVAHQLC